MKSKTKTYELRTGEEWSKYYGITVLDADGWTPRGDFYTELLTAHEFSIKVTHCTVQFPFPEKYRKEFEK